jgi:hypothetical protein
MLRKFVCAGFIVAVGLSVAMADEFTANISKVDGNKVTFTKLKVNPDTKTIVIGEPTTLPVTADAKITKGKFNKDTNKFEAGDTLPNGLKNEVFTAIGKKGVSAIITTDTANKNITAIKIGETAF